MKEIIKKYKVVFMVLLLFIILLFFVQWIGNQGRIQKMGKLAKSYIEEEDKTEKIVLGENFVITQRELEYAIITENFKRDLRPEQHALDNLIRSKVVLVQAKKEGVVLTKQEKEQGKEKSPLVFLGLKEPYEMEQFFAAWESIEAGEEAMEHFIDESLLIRKYWNTKKQQFFSTKEDLVLETLYWQQPRIVEYVQKLMADPALTWRDTVKKFLYDCCYGEKSGIAVLTIEEQQLIFKRLSKESYQVFRQKQRQLFGKILETFGIEADAKRINLFTNLSLTVMVIRRALPDTLPLFVPEAADETIDVQLDAIVDVLEKLKTASSS